MQGTPRIRGAGVGNPLSRRDLLLSMASLSTAAWPLWGQNEPTFSTDVKVVNVFASVRSKQGQIIRNLNRDDFTLEEDGRPQTIGYFSRETNLRSEERRVGKECRL